MCSCVCENNENTNVIVVYCAAVRFFNHPPALPCLLGHERVSFFVGGHTLLAQTEELCRLLGNQPAHCAVAEKHFGHLQMSSVISVVMSVRARSLATGCCEGCHTHQQKNKWKADYHFHR